MDPFTANNANAEQIKKGVIPNKARAEEIATRQFNAAKKVRRIFNDFNGSAIKPIMLGKIGNANYFTDCSIIL